MPTQAEYRARLHPMLTVGFAARTLATPAGEAFSIDDLAGKLGGILAELERQHLGAAAHVRALSVGAPTAPWAGHGELAFLLYHLHNPPPELRAQIDARPALRVVWDAMAAAAAPSPLSRADFAALRSALPGGAEVYCNEWGEIYGAGTYEQLDPRWAYALADDLMNHLPKWMDRQAFGIADFVTGDWAQPCPLAPGGDGQVRIAIIGDWGAGAYPLGGAGSGGPAVAVMQTLEKLPHPPDYLIHLGDTYYAGTGPGRLPENEETQNLLDVLKQHGAVAKPGRCFTLNSNHEMYGGAHGYYGALSDPLFRSQRGCSYFALEFGEWIIAGIDSAYFDPSTLYLEGGLGPRSQNPQYAFLQQVAARGKRVILLSHHAGLSNDGGSPTPYLWNDVSGVIKPEYWYWGHVHLGMAYSANACSGRIKTRCIGHSAIPFATPPGMEKCKQNIDWYAHGPLQTSAAALPALYTRPRARNGFAMLTLGRDGIIEEAYDMGSTAPVWTARQGARA